MTTVPVLARLAIDRGGTFTDSICTRGPGYDDIVVKVSNLEVTLLTFQLLSVDPANYDDAPTEWYVHYIAMIADSDSIRRILEIVTGKPIPKGQKLSLEQVESIRMGTTVSTNALLERQGERCALITTKGYRDVMKIGMQARPSIFDLSIKKLAFLYEEVVEVDERVTIETFAQDPDPQPIDLAADPALIKIVSRSNSATADAYLTPVTRRYLESFGQGFEGGIEAFGNKLLFMQSDGGLCTWNNFSGLRAILSGPAGGVIGFTKTCYDETDAIPLIGCDIGGTSGKLEHVFETAVAQVAAGGGSRLTYRNGMFVVGPESAGAHPGPACYKKGGPLAITDANLVLGRLLPEHFPAIFGPNEDEPLDVDASRKLFQQLADTINSENKSNDAKLTIEQVAAGFLNVASEAVCRPIRSESQEPTSLTLGPDAASNIKERFTKLESGGASKLNAQGFASHAVRHERYLNCRYQGSATQLMITQPEDLDFAAAFITEHKQQFGFTLQNRAILCDDVRVRSIVISHLQDIPSGSQIQGPAILFDTTQTILVEPNWVSTVLDDHVLIDVKDALDVVRTWDIEHVDPVKLAVMGHRFMSIAEQMGSILRQTAISTNIKERLDFSCALADIGGMAAGSMPPFSKEIWQEGAQIKSFKIVKKGIFDENGVKHHFYDEPSKYPGCSGTRTLADNISDLKAQVASCLIKQDSLEVVQFYMAAIQSTAEQAVRGMLCQIYKKFEGRPLEAVDMMDDGAEIRLKITIDPVEGGATFDFTGTSEQVYGNLNAPTAILYSGVIYVLRSLLSVDIPLNQGCLLPIKIILPKGTLLSPSEDAATVGGNVDTSQRVTDTILRAFQACGASQAGGAGAGPSWQGQDCVHVHMTNTAIGDVEIIERQYPVIIHEFSQRTGSGGAGKFRGGDGCVRDIEFTRKVDVAILSQRRAIAPYGMCGGDPGAKGVNQWIRKTEDGVVRLINLGGNNECVMNPGDHIIINEKSRYAAPPSLLTRANGFLASYYNAQNTN
ncbi:uncharacterized protein IL334_005138 [Kwoniella shivajii]|uniref:Cytoplasmic protein n=1 Tax=Kwoniella shivajii TaxID=564305 RepID=A0ABZ1D2I6_9TREE|nr:hypothetical protein IL334_005138 [Kwoniella shivajii]